ncbi:MAG: aminoglycoside phosphotransferase family protein, partial [Cyanobacteria bacterium P01_F01_bin.42]
ESHMCDRLSEPQHKWKIPRVLRSEVGEHHVKDSSGEIWRALGFIEGAVTYDQIENPTLAYEVGVGLGTFHRLIHDLPLEPMVDTLEGFHVTPNYLRQYDQICDRNDCPSGELAEYCTQSIGDRRSWADVLERAKGEGRLKLRPIHGDPKVNNVMIDACTGKAISLIDLDTVKPGLIHYDIGDCLRSGCNPLGEETQRFEDVVFKLDLCEGILKGYRSAARNFLSEHDYDYIYDCIRLLAFELGLRFFSDFINQNQYFKADYELHNLHRAVVQFKLVESIEAQRNEIQNLVGQLR